MRALKIILITTVVAISCDQGTKDFIEGLNEGPRINFGNGSESAILSDSIKVLLGDFKLDPTFYPISLNVTDANNNLNRIEYTQLEGIGTLLQNGDTLRDNNISLTADGDLEFEYYPQNYGNHRFLLTAIDDFDQSVSARVELVAFENLPPVAVFTSSRLGQLSPFHYQLDASESFDRDEKYGGRIIDYEFTILDVRNTTFQGSLEYVFPGPGNYKVSVRVRDNNDQFSEKAERNIVIE